jgi:hypothetical protein
MSKFCRAAAIIAVAAQLTTATPVYAADNGPRDEAAELAREGIEKLMQALQMLIKNIPQYEVPTMNENGDIIIKRKNPPGQTTPKKDGGTQERNI